MSDLPASKWFVMHHRMGPSVPFGPFDTYEEASAWNVRENRNMGMVLPMHPPVPADQVDWGDDWVARAHGFPGGWPAK